MTTPSRPSRYESLDLWRGLACLLVVVVHAGHIAKDQLTPEAVAAAPFGARLLIETGRMGIGVQIFFVISGYCIAATADAARQKKAAGGQFFVRRFRRIFPPYWIALALTAVVVLAEPVLGVTGVLSRDHANTGPLIPHPSKLTPLQWLGNLTLTEHWRWHLGGDPELKLHGPSWTLCYEEQFYAVCGVFLLVARRWFFAAVTATTLAVAGLMFTSMVGGWKVPSGFFFDGTWLLFAAGVGVYWHRSQPVGRRWVIPALLVGFVLVGLWYRYVFLALSPDRDMKQQAFEWVIGAGFGLLLIVLLPVDSRLAASLVVRPITLCGKMCYSLYLIHWPVGLLVAAYLDHIGVRGVWQTLLGVIPAATLISVVASAAFYWLIERHFLSKPSVPQTHSHPDTQTAPTGGPNGPPAGAGLFQPALTTR